MIPPWVCSSAPPGPRSNRRQRIEVTMFLKSSITWATWGFQVKITHLFRLWVMEWWFFSRFFWYAKYIGIAWIEQRFWEFYTRKNEDDLKDFHFDTNCSIIVQKPLPFWWPCLELRENVRKNWWFHDWEQFVPLWSYDKLGWIDSKQKRGFQVYDCAVPMRQVPLN